MMLIWKRRQLIALVLKIPDLLPQSSNPGMGQNLPGVLFFYAAKWRAKLDHDHCHSGARFHRYKRINYFLDWQHWQRDPPTCKACGQFFCTFPDLLHWKRAHAPKFDSCLTPACKFCAFILKKII
jgi:hypothetical protein